MSWNSIIGAEPTEESAPPTPAAIVKVPVAELPRYEQLVRIAQGLDRKPTNEQREAALTELISMFMPLIHKTANTTYPFMRNNDATVTIEEWVCETISMFFELVMTHYKPKNEGGAANFGPYMKVLLFNKMRFKVQQVSRINQKLSVTSIDAVDYSNTWNLKGDKVSLLAPDIQRALVADLQDIDEEMLENIRDIEIADACSLIARIVSEILTPREQLAWGLFYGEQMPVKDIAVKIVEAGFDKANRSRIHLTMRRSREKVLAEFARRRAIRNLLDR